MVTGLLFCNDQSTDLIWLATLGFICMCVDQCIAFLDTVHFSVTHTFHHTPGKYTHSHTCVQDTCLLVSKYIKINSNSFNECRPHEQQTKKISHSHGNGATEPWGHKNKHEARGFKVSYIARGIL